MGPNEAGLDKGFIASEAMNQFSVVKLTDVEECAVQADDDANWLGVVQEEVLTGDNGIGRRVVNVRMVGITRAVVATAGTLDIGDFVVATTDGELVAVPSTAGDYFTVGWLMTKPEDDGDHVDLMLTPGRTVTVSG